MEKKKVILKIEIKGGQFVSTRGAEVNEFRPDFVRGNGWRCVYYSDGSIRCKAAFGSDANNPQSISFKISQYGYVSLAKTCNGQRTEIRTVKLRRWPSDGIIALTDGEIDERYAYFHDRDYLEFLNRNDIYSVKNKEPNCTYTLYKCFSQETGKNVREEIYTDGKILELGKNSGRTQEWEKKYPGTLSFEEYQVLKAVDATWVIISEEKGEWSRAKRILYTLKDVYDIQKLPECK